MASIMGKHVITLQDGDYPCQYAGCRRRYKSKFSLRRHYLSHLNARHHRCPFCHKGFALAQYLREHIHIHTGAKPFICSYPGCGKQFRQAGKLSIHRKEHSGHRAPIIKPESAATDTEAVSNLYAIRAVFEDLRRLTIPSYFYTKVLPVPAQVSGNQQMMKALQQDYKHHINTYMQTNSAPTSSMPSSPVLGPPSIMEAA